MANTTDTNVKSLMTKLTKDRFKFSAISQKIIKKYWSRNRLISYKDFAKKWLKEHSNGEINYDELAYNKFMKKYGDKTKWFNEKKAVIKKIKTMGLL